MGLDIWFREDVTRVLAAVAIARGDQLTPDGLIVLEATAAGFGLALGEILPADQGGRGVVWELCQGQAKELTAAECRR